MLNIEGLNRVTKLEKRGKVILGVLYNSYPKYDKAGEFDTEFVQCRFVGEAAQTMEGVADKTKIYISEGCLRMQKGKYPVVTVFKCTLNVDTISR